jgi:Flp pilus assembly protein TadD
MQPEERGRVACRTQAAAWLVFGALACAGPSTQVKPDHALPDSEEPATPKRSVPQASALVQQAETQLQEGDVSGAEALLLRALREQPDDARAQLDLGIAKELQDDLAGAEAAYRAAIALQPDLAEALNNLGVLLRDRGALDEAIVLLRRATEQNPGSAAAQKNLALAFEDHGELEAAERAYRTALRLGADPLTQANLGLLLLKRGDAPAARRELQLALTGETLDRPTLLAIGNGLRRAGDPQGALRAMESALQGASEPTPALLSELALAQRAAGQRERALQTLERALARDPRYATAHYILGSMLASDGKRREAKQHLQRYLELEPHGSQAAEARKRLALLGKP